MVTRLTDNLAQEIRVSTDGVLDCGVGVHDGAPCLQIGLALRARRIKQLDPPGRQAGTERMNCSQFFCNWEGSEFIHVPHCSTGD
jgi:hypothetical protein